MQISIRELRSFLWLVLPRVGRLRLGRLFVRQRQAKVMGPVLAEVGLRAGTESCRISRRVALGAAILYWLVFPAPRALAVDCPARGAPAAVIPFTLTGDHIYVDAMANDTGPYRFIVDTGGVNLIDDSLVKPLSLKIAGTETGHGTGPGTVESGKTTVDRLALGDATFRAQKFYTFDFEQLYPGGGVAMKGMVGAPLFSRYVTCIDFREKVIDLIDPARFDRRRAGAALPMSLKESEITVDGSFDGLPGVFQIDTGSSGTLTLTAPFVARHDLLIRFPRHVEASSGGVGGSTKEYTVRGRKLVLGSADIERPITGLAVGSKGQLARADLSGIVGIGALERYLLVFDFPGQRLFLQPYRPAPAGLDTYDRSGLHIEAAPTGFRIVSVAEGTPAAEAGLRPGDLIVAVDGRPATSIPLPTMRDDLRRPSPGSIVRLEVKTDDKVRSVHITLRDLL